MGRRRFKPQCFSETDKNEFLKALGDGRSQLLKFCQEFALEKPLRSACDALISAVDGTAEVLTGDRTYFHAKDWNVRPEQTGAGWSDEQCRKVALAFGLDVGEIRKIGQNGSSSPHVRPLEYADPVPGKWCTVTVVNASGQRFSIDVLATSTYDAAHLYVTHAKTQPEAKLPSPTAATNFEVVFDGKIHVVKGSALAEWIQRRRQEWTGPRGMLFNQRPTL